MAPTAMARQATAATTPRAESREADAVVADRELREVTRLLVSEFAGVVPAARVLACVDRCRRHLLETGIRHGLVAATEAAARITLTAALAPDRAG